MEGANAAGSRPKGGTISTGAPWPRPGPRTSPLSQRPKGGSRYIHPPRSRSAAHLARPVTALGRLATSLPSIDRPRPPLWRTRRFRHDPSRIRKRCGPADTTRGRTCSSSLAALSRPKAADATLGRIPLLSRSAAHAGRRHGPRRDRPPIACCGHGPWPRTARMLAVDTAHAAIDRP